MLLITLFRGINRHLTFLSGLYSTPTDSAYHAPSPVNTPPSIHSAMEEKNKTSSTKLRRHASSSEVDDSRHFRFAPVSPSIGENSMPATMVAPRVSSVSPAAVRRYRRRRRKPEQEVRTSLPFSFVSSSSFSSSSSSSSSSSPPPTSSSSSSTSDGQEEVSGVSSEEELADINLKVKRRIRSPLNQQPSDVNRGGSLSDRSASGRSVSGSSDDDEVRQLLFPVLVVREPLSFSAAPPQGVRRRAHEIPASEFLRGACVGCYCTDECECTSPSKRVRCNSRLRPSLDLEKMQVRRPTLSIYV